MSAPVSAELVAMPSIVLDRLRGLGVDVSAVLRHAAIPSSRFVTNRTMLSVPEFFRFWRALEAVGGSRDLGLRIGKEAQPHQLDVASMTALHSANLGDALEKFSRYKRLVCGEQVSVVTSKNEARIRFHWVHVEETQPMMLVDVTFASLVSLASHGIGAPVVPIRVDLARRRSDEPMLHRAFGCPIRFDMPVDELVLEASLLARPFVTRNTDLLAMLVPALESELERTSRSLADDVRTALSRSMTGERPSVDKIATAMHMSARTLQRRLGDLGTSYQRLLDDVRHDTSRRLLSGTDLDASEIAVLIGFEELNSFSRAFHGWEGTTPTRFREGR